MATTVLASQLSVTLHSCRIFSKLTAFSFVRQVAGHDSWVQLCSTLLLIFSGDYIATFNLLAGSACLSPKSSWTFRRLEMPEV